jgi:hypothetical protein
VEFNEYSLYTKKVVGSASNTGVIYCTSSTVIAATAAGSMGIAGVRHVT